MVILWKSNFQVITEFFFDKFRLKICKIWWNTNVGQNFFHNTFVDLFFLEYFVDNDRNKFIHLVPRPYPLIWSWMKFYLYTIFTWKQNICDCTNFKTGKNSPINTLIKQNQNEWWTKMCKKWILWNFSSSTH